MNSDLQEVLASKGYLSVLQFVTYLKENYPLMAASYPTIMKMVKGGEIEAVRVGKSFRIPKESIDTYCDSVKPLIASKGKGGASKAPPKPAGPKPKIVVEGDAEAEAGAESVPSWLGPEPPKTDHLPKSQMMPIEGDDDMDL